MNFDTNVMGIAKFNTPPYTTFLMWPQIQELRELKEPVILGVIFPDEHGDYGENDATLGIIGTCQVDMYEKGSGLPVHYIRAWYDTDLLCPIPVKKFFEDKFMQLLVDINRGKYTDISEVVEIIRTHLLRISEG